MHSDYYTHSSPVTTRHSRLLKKTVSKTEIHTDKIKELFVNLCKSSDRFDILKSFILIKNIYE